MQLDKSFVSDQDIDQVIALVVIGLSVGKFEREGWWGDTYPHKQTRMAATTSYSDRVTDILEYVERHPIDVTSGKMFYVPTRELDPTR